MAYRRQTPIIERGINWRFLRFANGSRNARGTTQRVRLVKPSALQCHSPEMHLSLFIHDLILSILIIFNFLCSWLLRYYCNKFKHVVCSGARIIVELVVLCHFFFLNFFSLFLFSRFSQSCCCFCFHIFHVRSFVLVLFE